jgi:hypothetical protein
LTLFGFAVSFGVIALFKAQAALDQLVELYGKGFEAPQAPQLAAAGARPAPAPRETREPVPPTRITEPATARVPGEIEDTVGSSQAPPVASARPDEPPRTGSIAARWPQIAPDATPRTTPAAASKGVAARVDNAQGVADLALPDRSQEPQPNDNSDLGKAETAGPDDSQFSSVKVHRPGGAPSVHRVPREFPKMPREW